MTGLPYHDRLELNINNKRHRGCGSRPDDLLRNTHWQIEQINDERLADHIDFDLTFLKDNAVAESAGCNRFLASTKCRVWTHIYPADHRDNGL